MHEIKTECSGVAIGLLETDYGTVHNIEYTAFDPTQRIAFNTGFLDLKNNQNFPAQHLYDTSVNAG